LYESYHSIYLSLLAGISGTGKTRFVREQVKKSSKQFGLADNYNYCLIPVRPDWHEPSDLLGYISRISGTHYVVSDFLIFIVKAWFNAIETIEDNKIKLKPLEQIVPFWLCLDEMNLAPVEQYFADYLSILETREWKDEEYSCDPILKKDVFGKLSQSKIKGIETNIENNSLELFWSEIFADINLEEGQDKKAICHYFEQNGISLPPNLIVAGTVNMDETTHGFSRKVIDRALTIDFQEFFPNDYDDFFAPKSTPKLLNFPIYSQISQQDFTTIDADPDGAISRNFLSKVNSILKDTPFELAFRALNELLLSVVCFKPADEIELAAVWDDFLMQKVLPRIEGDVSKLKYISTDSSIVESGSSNIDEKVYGKGSVLHRLYTSLSEEEIFGKIWKQENFRPDLLREALIKQEKDQDEELLPLPINCRSKKKLEWMMRRLKSSHFTDFWV